MEIFLGIFENEWERRREQLLYELSWGAGEASSAEEELERRLKALQQAGGAAPSGAKSHGRAKRRPSAKSAPKIIPDKPNVQERPMEVRLEAIAKGSQPSVVKMASYGGGARFGAMINYVSRSGEVRVENENGERLEGREELARLRSEWEPLFQNRAESRDIGTFRAIIEASGFGSEESLHAFVRDALSGAFGNRKFAYSVTQPSHGTLAVEGIVVLRSDGGERLTGDSKAREIIQQRYNSSHAADSAKARFDFTGYGNGVDYGAAKLRDLTEAARGDVHDDAGRVIADTRSAGDLVLKNWRRELHSRKGRDVMHVIMSSQAGTDTRAFENAVRDFLAAQFEGHRYIFAMHDPISDPKEAGQGGKRPHIHAHAIISMRSVTGERIETSPLVFRQWREVMAEKARAHGIAMEMTDRREFASAPAYTRNQVRPVSYSRDGRTEHEGTSSAAQERYVAKRTGRKTIARSTRSREYTIKVKQSWANIALASGDKRVVAYATHIRDVVNSMDSLQQEAQSNNVIHADFRSQDATDLVNFKNTILEGPKVREMTRSEFEAYEKEVETSLFRLGRNLGTEEQADLEQVAQFARSHVNLMREHMELSEQRGPTEQGIDQPDLSADASEGVSSNDPGKVEAISDSETALDIYGQDQVSAGDVMMGRIENTRYAIELAKEDGRDTDSLESKLNTEISEAAIRAVNGNAYLRMLAEEDPMLKSAIQHAEENNPVMAIEREPGSEIAKPVAADENRPVITNEDNPDQSLSTDDLDAKAAEESYQSEIDRTFPDEISNRYYIREERSGTQRVFADSKGEREIFQDNGEKLRAKAFDPQGVRLMVETSAHRGWTTIEITGSKEFRREAWLEGQAHGITVKGYQPNELDWQELAQREQNFLRNEIIPVEARSLEGVEREQEPIQDARATNGNEEGKTLQKQQESEKSGDIPSKTVDYKDGLKGKLVDVGLKAYQDNEKNEPSPFVVIETANGNKTVWGVGLPDALHRSGAEVGDEIHLRSTGTERVMKTVLKEINGQKQRVEQMVDRRAWEATVLRDRDLNQGKVEGSKQLDNRDTMEAKAVVRDGETVRTDPPQQQVPRLQQLEQEKQQQRERDENER